MSEGFEMTVVDMFTIKGRGPCVTGMVTAGEPDLGDRLAIGSRRYVCIGIETQNGKKGKGRNVGILLGIDSTELVLPAVMRTVPG